MRPAGLLLLAAVLGLVVQLWRLGRRWSAGRRVRVDWIAGFARLPRAYLHTVHGVVARDPYAARMHVLIAGGFVAALAFSLPLQTLTIEGWGLPTLVLAASAASLAGVAMVAARRLPPRPARLSGGAFDVQPFAFLAVLLFLAIAAIATTPLLDAVGLALGAFGLGWLVYQAFGGPMRHALAGAAHLVAHSRPDRFTGTIDAALRPLDLQADRLGATDARDFGWNELAAFDACVQCGRCEAACPAFAAGQPLNPKALINDLVRSAGPGVAVPYLGSPHAGVPDAVPETIWACTTCRACVYECPMLIEHVDAVIELRRHVTLELGTVPDAVGRALTELKATDTAAGRALGDRLDWAADLSLPLLADKQQAEILLWLGDGAYDRRHQRTLRALIRLLRIARVDFAVLGTEELDCGDLARRLGDEATFQDLAARNIAILGRYRFRQIITADPHVLHALGQEYLAFGGNYEVVHHAVFLDQLIDEGRLRPLHRPDAGAVTFHDPCYLGRYGGEVAAPRRLLEKIGVALVEMERSGMRASCCGGGGGAALSDVPGKRRIPDMRMDQARATGAATVAVGCPNCMQMLEGVVGPRPAISDLAELVLAAVEGPA